MKWLLLAKYKYVALVITALVVLLLYTTNAVTKENVDGYQSIRMPTEMILINLDSRKDRLASFQKYFDKSDAHNYMKLHRISAVIGKDIPWRDGILTPTATTSMEIMLRTGKRKNHDELTIGAIGCYMSHLKALKRVIERNEAAIICEDDLILPSDFYKRMEIGLLLTPFEENPLLLFHVICNGWSQHKCTLIKPNLYKVHKFWSLACYYVTPSVAKKIVEHAKPFDVQIDAMLGRLTQQSILNIYAYPITHTNVGLGSNIQIPLET